MPFFRLWWKLASDSNNWEGNVLGEFWCWNLGIQSMFVVTLLDSTVWGIGDTRIKIVCTIFAMWKSF